MTGILVSEFVAYKIICIKTPFSLSLSSIHSLFTTRKSEILRGKIKKCSSTDIKNKSPMLL
jgi:hypothetical protein